MGVGERREAEGRGAGREEVEGRRGLRSVREWGYVGGGRKWLRKMQIEERRVGDGD